LLGANASGKTSIIAPLLLLKQTLEAKDSTISLKTKGGLFNAGFYKDFIFCHNKDLLLSLEIRFGKIPEKIDIHNTPLYKIPPSSLKLTYKYSSGESPTLQEYSVSDGFNRMMLLRRRQSDDAYSLEEIPNLNDDSTFTKIIKNSSPRRFLFDSDKVFAEYFEAVTKLPMEQEKTNINIKINNNHNLYLQTVSYVSVGIENLLSNISYIGPIREKPRRNYSIGGEKPYSVSPTGYYSPEIFFREKRKDVIINVNKWIKQFGFGKKLVCHHRKDEEIFYITLQNNKSPKINIADTGFGFSQVFPLIVQGFFAKSGSTIITEQPEIHLNPRLQTLLADLFVEITNRKVNLIIETHSEHFLLRLRRLIAEEKIKNTNIALYYTECEKSESKVKEIKIDNQGHIEDRDWPKGFFEDDLNEAFALAAAQIKKQKKTNKI
jgi:hypothetical protein